MAADEENENDKEDDGGHAPNCASPINLLEVERVVPNALVCPGDPSQRLGVKPLHHKPSADYTSLTVTGRPRLTRTTARVLRETRKADKENEHNKEDDGRHAPNCGSAIDLIEVERVDPNALVCLARPSQRLGDKPLHPKPSADYTSRNSYRASASDADDSAGF